MIDFPTDIMSKTIIRIKYYDDNCYSERTIDISPEKIKFKDFKNTFVDHYNEYIYCFEYYDEVFG